MDVEYWSKVAPIVSSCAIVISAIVAALVFWYTRWANRRRATLDMVMRTFLDPAGTKLYDDFKNVIRRDQDPGDSLRLVELVDYTSEIEEVRNTVIDQLNNYELVALGIRQKVFEEKFYKLWFHRQFTRDFESVSALIDAIQAKKPSTYCEFRALYNKWKRNQHPVNQPSRLKLAYWSLTGDFKRLDVARAAMRSSPGGQPKRD